MSNRGEQESRSSNSIQSVVRGIFRLDWQSVGGNGVAGHSMVVRDASEALRIVEGLGRASRYGEYRVSAPACGQVYTTTALIRQWCAEGGQLPEPYARSMWKRDVERAQELEALVANLRTTLGAAVRKGLLPQSAVAQGVHMVQTAAVDALKLDDVCHGRLAR